VPLAARARRLHAAFLEHDSAALEAEVLVVELLSLFARAAAGSTGRPTWLARVEERLCAAGVRTPALDELAAVAGVHAAHLTRAFRRAHGCSIGQWLRARRVEAAARELVAGQAPLSEVALRHGFCDQSHFHRAFRRMAGSSPGRYQRLAQASRRSALHAAGEAHPAGPETAS
jgi:AraC family transcriptional regulator